MGEHSVTSLRTLMNSSGAELLRPFPSKHARRRGRGGSPDVRVQRPRAAGVKRLEDGRAQVKRGVLREGPPSPAGTHGENRVAESRF